MGRSRQVIESDGAGGREGGGTPRPAQEPLGLSNGTRHLLMLEVEGKEPVERERRYETEDPRLGGAFSFREKGEEEEFSEPQRRDKNTIDVNTQPRPRAFSVAGESHILRVTASGGVLSL